MSGLSWLFGNRRRADATDQILDQAVRELRVEAAPEQLSAKARAFVVEEVVSGSGSAAPSGLRQVVRLALALGTVPVVACAVLLIAIGHGPQPNGPDWVKVEKMGGEVVFTLGDPTRSHRVLASTDARGFSGARELRTVDGEILVSASQEPKLVFYRVD